MKKYYILAALFLTLAVSVYAQLDLKGKAVETLTNGVMKELDKKFTDMVAKEALSAAVKANIVKNLSEMSRPIVKNFIDSASSGKLPNVSQVVTSVMKEITPRVQELIAAALTESATGAAAQIAGQPADSSAQAVTGAAAAAAAPAAAAPAPAAASAAVAAPAATSAAAAAASQTTTVGGNLGAFSIELYDNFKYGDNYQFIFTDKRLFNGQKIVRGDTYTLKITYTASRDLEDTLNIMLVDTSPAVNNWKVISASSGRNTSIAASKAGKEVSKTVTLKATANATDLSEPSNALVFQTRGKGKIGVADSGVKKAVTLNFTEFIFTRNGDVAGTTGAVAAASVTQTTVVQQSDGMDTIVLQNGNMIDAKVEEITPTEIKYRRFDNLSGPLFSVYRSDVLSIKYGNGVVDIINSPGQKSQASALNPDKLYTGFSLEPSGFIAGGPSATLEFSKGAFMSSIHASFPSLALNSTASGFGFGAGGSLNYYWGGPIGGFFMGGTFEWNMFPYSYTVYNPYKAYDYKTDTFTGSNTTEKTNAHSFILALNGGYKFVLKNGIYFRTGVAAGVSLSPFFSPGFYYKPDLATGYIF